MLENNGNSRKRLRWEVRQYACSYKEVYREYLWTGACKRIGSCEEIGIKKDTHIYNPEGRVEISTPMSMGTEARKMLNKRMLKVLDQIRSEMKMEYKRPAYLESGGHTKFPHWWHWELRQYRYGHKIRW